MARREISPIETEGRSYVAPPRKGRGRLRYWHNMLAKMGYHPNHQAEGGIRTAEDFEVHWNALVSRAQSQTERIVAIAQSRQIGAYRN